MFGFGKSKDSETQEIKIQGVAALEKELSDYEMTVAPTSTTMPANEMYLLEQAGYKIVQVVFGNVVYSMGLKGLFRSVKRAFQQGEMVDFTRMINDARLIARVRMLKQAADLGATDVIGVVLETHEYADFLEVTAMGTAVRKISETHEVPIAVGA